MTKIKIPLSEKNRYVDLMGDPIHRNKTVSFVLSQEFSTLIGASAAAGFTDAENPVSTALYILCMSSMQTGFIRFGVDNVLLGPFGKNPSFLEPLALKDLCIDKKPTQEDCINSLSKYGSAAKFSRNGYSILSAALLFLMAGSLTTPETTVKAFQCFAPAIRIMRGLYRTQKILSGEWAIVAMPKEQEKIKDYLEFDIPDIKLPEIKQPSPAPTFGRHAPGC